MKFFNQTNKVNGTGIIKKVNKNGYMAQPLDGEKTLKHPINYPFPMDHSSFSKISSALTKEAMENPGEKRATEKIRSTYQEMFDR